MSYLFDRSSSTLAATSYIYIISYTYSIIYNLIIRPVQQNSYVTGHLRSVNFIHYNVNYVHRGMHDDHNLKKARMERRMYNVQVYVYRQVHAGPKTGGSRSMIIICIYDVDDCFLGERNSIPNFVFLRESRLQKLNSTNQVPVYLPRLCAQIISDSL